MRLLFLYLLVTSTTIAQPLTDTQKLASLGQIWGFLKYYHPAVAGGQHDWDAQLLRLIPRVRKATNQSDLSAVYLHWLDSLGVVPACRRCRSVDQFDAAARRNLGLAFLTDSTLFSSALQTRLIYIRDNRHTGQQHYIDLPKAGGMPSFKQENPYPNLILPDEPYRLLALFRYWNVIHYFYPYKYTLDNRWTDVLPALIPVFREADTEQAYQNAIYRAVARIQDSHGWVAPMSQSRCLKCDQGMYWLPFEMKFIGDEAVVTRIFADSLVRSPLLSVGTRIQAIDGEIVSRRLDRLRPYVSASNELALRRDLRQQFGAGHKTQAVLQIEHNGHDTTLTIPRYPYPAFGSTSYRTLNDARPAAKWLTDSVSYLNFQNLKDYSLTRLDSLMQAFGPAKALICDLRNYRRDMLWFVGRYVATRNVPFVKITGPDPQWAGMFRVVEEQRIPSPRRQTYRGKVLLLVDEDTQSSAEFLTMAFRAVPSVVLVGSHTAGADGNVVQMSLPGGYLTSFSSLGVYFPDGRETQRVGIAPDVLVRPTVEGIRAGRDEVLEKALEVAR